MDEQSIEQASWQISFNKQPQQQQYTGDVNFTGDALAAAVAYTQLMTAIAKKTQVVSDKRKFYLAIKELGLRDGFVADEYKIQYVQSALVDSAFDFKLNKAVGASLTDAEVEVHFVGDPMSCVWPTEIIGKALVAQLSPAERESFSAAVATTADTQMASLEQMK